MAKAAEIMGSINYHHMRHITLLALLFVATSNICAQYSSIEIQKAEPSNLNLVQIDFGELSTLCHFQYTSTDAKDSFCIDEDTRIKDKGSNREFKLLRSINMPFCDKKHGFDHENQVHNFTLEFEPIPKAINEFDILGNPTSGPNFYGVRIDTTKRELDFKDLSSFIEETPVKEFGFFYKDGNRVLYQEYNGLLIAVLLINDNSYGKYYQANILIQNLTGRDFHFHPDKIRAEYLQTVKAKKRGKNKYRSRANFDDVYFDPEMGYNHSSEATVINDTLIKYDAKVLTFNEYLQRVKNQQAWATFAVALSESLAASNAGYTSSTTRRSAHGSSEMDLNAAGYVGNDYANISARSRTSYNESLTSYSKTYDTKAAYDAHQNAGRNIKSFRNQQYEIKRSLSEGYLKLNTIMNETEYIGYINIQFAKADLIRLFVPVNGTTFTFEW